MCEYNMPDVLVVASSNEHKIEEIRHIFSGVKIVSMKDMGFTDEIEESGTTFRKNAGIKALTVSKALNVPVLADDSGLCVDALGGAPGIYSSRFSGGGDEENRKLLLKQMQGIDYRAAHFECSVCLAYPDGRTLFGEGKTFGQIAMKETGKNGFGYDSLFISDDLGKSFGEATAEEKDKVSHRYRALCDLKSKITK